MKIEAGKYYRTRDGRKVGPMVRTASKVKNRAWDDGSNVGWTEHGAEFNTMLSRNDIIAEWTEGPVREVTRKEIVTGVYGRVMVSKSKTHASDICVELTGGIAFSRAELTAAIDTLTQIRDAMQEGGV
jgi:hypothetical protein